MSVGRGVCQSRQSERRPVGPAFPCALCHSVLFCAFCPCTASKQAFSRVWLSAYKDSEPKARLLRVLSWGLC